MLSEPLSTHDFPLLSSLLEHYSHLVLLLINCLLNFKPFFWFFFTSQTSQYKALQNSIPRIHSFSILTPLRSSSSIGALNKIYKSMPLKFISPVLTCLWTTMLFEISPRMSDRTLQLKISKTDLSLPILVFPFPFSSQLVGNPPLQLFRSKTT